MALRITLWTPDTCGCTLAYEWDDAAPPERRAHRLLPFATLVRSSQRDDRGQTIELPCRACPRHAVASPDHVLDANVRKNRALNIARDAMPEARRDEVAWRMTVTGDVEISTPEPLPASTRAAIEAVGARVR